MAALRIFARSFDKNANDADDLAQETLAKAFAGLDRFDQGIRLTSWRFTITRNPFCTKVGIAKRAAPGAERCVVESGVALSPQEWALHAKQLEEACNLWPEPYRIALDRLVVEERSCEVAAEQFGCAIGTAKSRINRATRRLAKHWTITVFFAKARQLGKPSCFSEASRREPWRCRRSRLPCRTAQSRQMRLSCSACRRAQRRKEGFWRQAARQAERPLRRQY